MYVKEIQPPANYQADPTVYPVDVNIGKTSTKNVLNERTPISYADDVSRDFENELTKIIGKLASKIISKND